jgi:hypothetical protein
LNVKLKTRKVAVFVTCLGIGGAVPVMSSADEGGTPNINSQNHPCKAKKKQKKHLAPNTNGKKCGFNFGGTTTTVAPTTTTTTTTTT